MTQPPAEFLRLCKQAHASHQQGALAEAERLYRQALVLLPMDFIASQLLGVLLAQQGRNEEALEAISTALARNPDSPPALLNQGNVLHALGRREEALASFDRAVALKQDYVEAWAARAKLLRVLGRPDEALTNVERALALRPDFVEALANRGNILLELGRPAEALASFDQAITYRPHSSELHCNRANALLALNRPAQALASCDRALTSQPDFVDALITRGNALRELDRPQEALDNYDRAISLQPGNAMAHSNRANALLDLNRPAEALPSYDRAILLEPDNADTHLNQSLANLVLGNLEKGFRQYEWRKKCEPHSISYPQPLWLGEKDISGKTLFVPWEQGFGDTIQFCRYAKLAEARGIRLVLSVQESLRGLLAQLGVEIIGPAETPAHFDYHCPMLSLPLAFGTTLETILRAPYLAADQDLSARWKKRLAGNGKPNIGLCWSGTARHKNDRNRSVALEKLTPLLTADANWTSLQVEVKDSDRAALSANAIIRHFDLAQEDFLATASLVQEMDLILTVDTALAHLAGAMGKKVWLMLPFRPDWRWLLERDDSPWYPGMTLFRQKKIGDWDELVARIATRLAAYVQDHP